ncbi:MAG: hypothetical protein RSE41_10185, partial [Clostridia bacterium]
MLPVIYDKTANITDSINEALRYFVIFAIFAMSSNKKFYGITLIVIGVMQVIIGIDGIGMKYLTPILSMFDSSYLLNEIRLSGTIQYANTVAILFVICNIYMLNKLDKRLYFCLFNILNIGLLLTNSRLAICIYLIAIILYLIKISKKNDITYIVISIIFSVISYSIMSRFLFTD